MVSAVGVSVGVAMVISAVGTAVEMAEVAFTVGTSVEVAMAEAGVPSAISVQRQPVQHLLIQDNTLTESGKAVR